MAGWTKKNFAEIEDSSTEDAMDWRMSRGAVRSRQVCVSRFTFAPDTRIPFGPPPREQEEVYVIVRGSGRAKLDQEIVEVARWDVIRVAPRVLRAFEAGPDGPDLVCVGGPRPKGGDTERDEALGEEGAETT